MKQADACAPQQEVGREQCHLMLALIRQLGADVRLVGVDRLRQHRRGANKIGDLARLSDVTFERDGGSFNHNFRTLIIDPNGHLQTVFPTGGNLSDAIVDEVLKAVAVTNAAASRNPAKGKQNEARNANLNAASAAFHGG